MDLPKDKSNYISLCPNNYSHPTQPLTNEGGREPSSIWLECPAYLFLPRPVNKSKKACCIYERAGFRCYTANSRLSHQAETCFMLSPEVWPGKLLSQASLPRSGEKKKQKSLLGSCCNKLGRGAAPEKLGSSSGQSRTLAALRAQSSPKLAALRSFLELRTLLLPSEGNREGMNNLGTGRSGCHKPWN
jgi:hypothetical protein